MINERLAHLIDKEPDILLMGWPWWTVLKAAKTRAKNKSLKFNLTDQWARQRYTGKCELSGLPFSLNHKSKRTMFSLSLDRISHGGDYTQDNCRFVLWGLNAMRGDTGKDVELLRICRAVADHYEVFADIDQEAIKLVYPAT